MKSVKPYGRSATEFVKTKLERKLLLKGSVGDLVRFETLETKSAFILSMWVSVIDKIAVKPTGQTKPTKKQRRFRHKLGESAWKYIQSHNLLPPEFEETFWSKVHPYPDGEVSNEAVEKKTQKKGRWFRTFFGDVSIFDADVDGFGQMVFGHLYNNARRIDPESEHRKNGLVHQRVLSLARSVPVPPRDHEAQKPGDDDKIDRKKAIHAPLWTPSDGKVNYCRNNDLPGEVFELASKLQRENRPLLNRHVGPILFQHYASLFQTADGSHVMKRAEVREDGQQGLLDYHDAVKDTYRRILAGHKARNSGSDNRLSKILPKTPGELYARVMAGRRNQNINGLIRLGKVAHYSFTEPNKQDRVAASVENWNPDAINNGPFYLTSIGQSEIKRNESLIRVWRSVLASAAVTLVDWVNPNPSLQGDPLTGEDFQSMMELFEEAHFDQKASLLFGASSNALRQLDKEEKRQVVKTLRDGIRDLRNAAFHYKGRADFASGLVRIGRGVRADQFRSLYQNDLTANGERYLRDLRGVDVEYFSRQHQLDGFLESLKKLPSDLSEYPPQPRLNRLLTRAENTWKGGNTLGNLPRAPNHRTLEAAPGLRCRYVCTKLLYDRVFPHWFSAVSTETLNRWKDAALERTTKAARFISKDEKAIAKAAAALDFGAEGLTSPLDLLARVSAETATEIRVQKGYDPDPANARDKSKYLDDVVLDIFSLAFDEFLGQPHLNWLTTLSDQSVKPGQATATLPETLPLTDHSKEAEDWRIVLYAILHFVSTAEVSQLLHQLKKWDVLSSPQKHAARSLEAEEKQIGGVMDVLRLYLDMADDKFDGADGIDMANALKPLFRPERLFEEVYPAKTLFEDDLIPLRGLREALRFGNLANQARFHSAAPIVGGFVQNLGLMERGGANSAIAKSQKSRTDLHALWVKNGCSLKPNEEEEYRNAIATIAKHRELSAHVRFVNHIRLHRLIMRLLGRLADYAGLFERDLYFASFGLMIDLGLEPTKVFTPNGLSSLKNGQVISALTNATDKTFLHKMNLYFGIDFTAESPLIEIRNKMQHLRLLFGAQGGEQATTSDLSMTILVNDLRKMMAYDRKLKNAVSKSIIGILEREKLDLTWKMKTNQGEHDLTDAKVATQQVFHIKSRNSGTSQVPENLNTVAFTRMVAALFGGDVVSVRDVANPVR